MSGDSFRRGQLVAGVDDVDTSEKNVKVDGPTQSIRINNWVWNTISMEWERMKQPTVEIGSADLTVTMGDVEKLLAQNYWKEKRIEYNAGDPIYIGYHTTLGVATSDSNWYVFKLTWSSGDMVRQQGPQVTSWDDRALGW